MTARPFSFGCGIIGLAVLTITNVPYRQEKTIMGKKTVTAENEVLTERSPGGRGDDTPAANFRGITPQKAEPTADVESAAAKRPRFHFFIIDSGWDSPATKVIRDNISMIAKFQNDDPLFVLSQEQSTALIRRHPHFLGKDPILLARDLEAAAGAGQRKRKNEYHGFHLNLGMIKDPITALSALQRFLEFIAAHRKSASIEHDVKAMLHREGIKGAIEVLRQGAEQMVGA
jgi:hypothetical protein